jgi:type IV pilus assembly protein PilE
MNRKHRDVRANAGKAATGMTLIELLVVVSIVGILAAVAYPTYINSVVKGRRASAQTFLLDIAQQQQQYLLDARSYAADLSTLNITSPTSVTDYYTITLVNAAGPPPTFTATATPILGKSQVNDGTLTINNSGAKTPSTLW